VSRSSHRRSLAWWVGWLARVGCSSSARPPDPREQSIAAAPVRLASARPEHEAFADEPADEPGEAAAMPGPNSVGARDPARLDANDECRNCHADIAREWAASSHASAYVDPMFASAFARESESPFCQGCHAPEADPARRPSERAAAIGVACVSCHLDLDGDTVLAGPATSATRPAPHPLRRTPAFAGPDACASCHEFSFPDARADPQLLMQRTIREHQASADADQPCQSCHMPERGHRFAVDDALLRAAADIVATREAAALVVTIEPRALGHAFPTGDLFRRLAVVVTSSDGTWSEQRFLARRFDVQEIEGRPIKIEVGDDRVGVRPGPTRVAFALPERVRGQALRWSVAWQRVLETPIGAAADAEVWDQRELASGESLDPAGVKAGRDR
jgi:hypothetical protein